jgi:tetratricopeptide (TPR) repeat protein
MALVVAAGWLPVRGQAGSVAEHERRAQEDLRAREPLKAIPELQAVVAAAPGNVEARANLGVLLYFQGRDAEAVPQLKAAVEAKPGLWKIRSLLGMAERGSGDEQGGRADLEAAYPEIEDQKLKVQVGQNLIESYAGTGELDKAAETIAGLLKVEPTNAALLYTSYRIHTDLAKTALLELGLAAPDSPQIHQAMAHEEQRDHDMAGTIANLCGGAAAAAGAGGCGDWGGQCALRRGQSAAGTAAAAAGGSG